MSTGRGLLSVQRLEVYRAGIRVLKDVSFEVPEGAIVTLIGSNGAGKSTTLNAISGLLKIAGGTIEFAGRSVGNMAAHAVAGLGLIQIPEGRRLFGRLSVHENLRLGAYRRNDRQAIGEDEERVLTLFPRLRERRHQACGTLSGGEQQMVAMARALMARPVMLLMDEPSMGLAPKMVDQVFDTLEAINQQGVAVLLVEQNAYLALEVASYAYVLANGGIAIQGTGSELRSSPDVMAAYLGTQLQPS
jgi:branched-chain amino acid transport system ATP-binding protein